MGRANKNKATHTGRGYFWPLAASKGTKARNVRFANRCEIDNALASIKILPIRQ